MLTQVQYKHLDENAYKIRTMALSMVTCSRWGHIGGSFSLAEVLSVLYGCYVKNIPGGSNPDRVVLSKAHCSPALYAALCLAGQIPDEMLSKYCRLDGLDGHLERLQYPGIETSGGSLGIGLSTAVGMALAMRMKGQMLGRVYCIVGDGELQEGQNWEAMMAAAQCHLDNLIIIVDYNKLQAKGFLYEEIGLEPLADKLKSFGLELVQCDGHDIYDIDRALGFARNCTRTGRPACVIAHTVKGKGVDECEFNSAWHTHPPQAEQAQSFLNQLAQRYGYAPVVLDNQMREDEHNTLLAGMEEEERSVLIKKTCAMCLAKL
jgi:transketolase